MVRLLSREWKLKPVVGIDLDRIRSANRYFMTTENKKAY